MNLYRIPKIQVGLTPRVASCDPRNIVTFSVKRYSFQTYDAVLYVLREVGEAARHHRPISCRPYHGFNAIHAAATPPLIATFDGGTYHNSAHCGRMPAGTSSSSLRPHFQPPVKMTCVTPPTASHI
jgi:hypothetical protein